MRSYTDRFIRSYDRRGCVVEAVAAIVTAVTARYAFIPQPTMNQSISFPEGLTRLPREDEPRRNARYAFIPTPVHSLIW